MIEKDTEGYEYDITMPKPRTLSVSKQCDECGQSSPVACRQCMHCKADFYSQANEGGDYSPENLVLDDIADVGASGERRRSERGRKREKPDYYDSLEFENKRKAERQTGGGGTKSAPNKGTTGSNRRDKSQGRSNPYYRSDSQSGDTTDKTHRISPTKFGRSKDKTASSGKGYNTTSTSSRAMLSWRKTVERDDRDDEGSKRKKKKKKNRDGAASSDGIRVSEGDVNA